MHADMKVLALSAEGVFKSHLAVMLRISMKLNALFPPNKKKLQSLLTQHKFNRPIFLQRDIACAESFYL